MPRSVLLTRDWEPIVELVDEWMVKDEWWRHLLARHYLRVILADGRVVTLFHDLVNNEWYQQHYMLPRHVR